MNVALDATPLTVPTGGVARYTLALARALAEQYPKDRYWLISDQPLPDLCSLLPPGSVPPNLAMRTFPSRRWWSAGILSAMSQLKVDLFHGTDFSVPYLPLRPSVMTLHDLSPWIPWELDRGPDPTWRLASARVRRRTPLLLRMRAARMVITPTEAIRRAAIDRFRLHPDQVIAIPLAADPMFHPVPGPPTPDPSTLDRSTPDLSTQGLSTILLSTPAPSAMIPYFLFVGTLEPRKNIGRLIAAWRELRKTRHVNLVLAGRVRSGFAPPEPEPGLHLLGQIPDHELPALYSNATAVLYPSLYEGFGLPVLEAMQCGALVITSRDPAISELTGAVAHRRSAVHAAIHPATIGAAASPVDGIYVEASHVDGIHPAAIHVDAGNTQALHQAMAAAQDGGPEVAAIREQALVRARAFRWSSTATLTHEVYSGILKPRLGGPGSRASGLFKRELP